MLNIFATTFMTATRSGCVEMREVRPAKDTSRRRWLRPRKTVCVDPAKL